MDPPGVGGSDDAGGDRDPTGQGSRRNCQNQGGEKDQHVGQQRYGPGFKPAWAKVAWSG
jgi:hypothetical protein